MRQNELIDYHIMVIAMESDELYAVNGMLSVLLTNAV